MVIAGMASSSEVARRVLRERHVARRPAPSAASARTPARAACRPRRPARRARAPRAPESARSNRRAGPQGRGQSGRDAEPRARSRRPRRSARACAAGGAAISPATGLLVLQALAEIAVQEAAEAVDVLRGERLVEPELLVQLRRPRPGRARRRPGASSSSAGSPGTKRMARKTMLATTQTSTSETPMRFSDPEHRALRLSPFRRPASASRGRCAARRRRARPRRVAPRRRAVAAGARRDDLDDLPGSQRARAVRRTARRRRRSAKPPLPPGPPAVEAPGRGEQPRAVHPQPAIAPRRDRPGAAPCRRGTGRRRPSRPPARSAAGSADIRPPAPRPAGCEVLVMCTCTPSSPSLRGARAGAAADRLEIDPEAAVRRWCR